MKKERITKNVLLEKSFFDMGQLIKTTRKGRKFSRQQLAQGLCNKTFLERVEEGRAEPDFFLLNVLLQRLGVCPSKLEHILSEKEYRLLEVRDQFVRLVFRGRGDWVRWLLSRFQDMSSGASLDRMFFYRYQAMYQYYIAGDKRQSAEELAKALLQTGGAVLSVGLPINAWLVQFQKPDQEEGANGDCLLSATELENLLALLRVLGELKELSSRDAVKTLCWCKEYIDRMVTDGEEHARISCKCAWLLAGYYMYQKEKADAAFDLCDSAFEELQDYGISYFMLPLLRRMLGLRSGGRMRRKKEKYGRYFKTLTRMYNVFGLSWRPEDSILYDCRPWECFLDYEVLRGGRRMLGYRQEQVIAGIFKSTRSLSQIENHQVRPSSKNYLKLMQKLDLYMARHHGRIVTDSVEMLAKEQELRRLANEEKHVEMERQIRKLRQGLNMLLIENRRAIRYYENMIDCREGNREYADVLWEDYRLLCKTYDLKKELHRTPFWMEAELINQIAIILRKIGREKECRACYRKVIETYRQSRVKERYHFCSCNVLLGNLAAREGSLELAQKAMRLSFECGEIHRLHYNYMTYLFALEQEGIAKKEDCQAVLEDIIVFCDLIKDEKGLAMVLQYYHENYRSES